MAITDYASLQTAISNWIRPGNTLSSTTQARIPEFIALFEGEINGTVNLRAAEIETALTATIGSNLIALPSDYESPVRLWLESFSPRRELVFKPPATLPYWAVSTYPTYWTIKAGNIALDRNAASAYPFTFRYRQHFALSNSQTTNALLTNYPSVYLYGSLIQSAPYLRDTNILALWQQRYQAAEERMMDAENLSKDLVTLAVDGGALPRRTSIFNIIEGL